MMFSYIEKIASLMSEADKDEYRRIYAPRVVAVPPADSRRDICVCEDGEIRAYGVRNKKNPFDEESGERMYIYSRDGGLTWKAHKAEAGDIGACVKIPWTGKYVTIFVMKNEKNGKPVTCRLLSNIGPGDTAPDIAPIPGATICIDVFQPYMLDDVRRIVCAAYHRDSVGCYHPHILISDDDGMSFSVKDLTSPPRFEIKWPHKGPRWENNGSEPSLTRLADGRLWMVIRTSQDYMYEYFSSDNGDSWQGPMQSRFHMTLTTPFVYTLRDGRTLLFWNNTHPLPEIDKETFEPRISEDGRKGIWEDVFTNRDISHAAVTEDSGKTFIGCRETYMSPIRNSVYYRSAGNYNSSADKSAHQHQAIELPYGKILLSVGQHEVTRRILIFDVRWLYEKERSELFREGLEHVSTHGYIKSYCESHTNEGPGHCQWNRVSTVYPVPDPSGNSYREVQQFVYSDDPRLVSGLSGMAWNYPACESGHIELELYRAKSGLRISLADTWINPTDETVYAFAKFSFEADESVLPEKEWITLWIEFDTVKGKLEYGIGDKKIGEADKLSDAPLGVSYLHLQTLARERDFEGAYLREIRKS